MLAPLLFVWVISASNQAQTCQLPAVASYRASTKCTAVLVHPNVVLTAAHCLETDDAGRMRFGESFLTEAFGSDIEHCEASDEWSAPEYGGTDYAFCVLAEPVTGLPIVPVLAPCEAKHLRPGTAAVVAGFGAAVAGGEFGIKRYAFTVIAGPPRPDGSILVGDSQVTGCLGDSGGPAMVQLPDGSWRVFGILSGGRNCGGGPSTYVLVHPRIDWFQQRSGYDLLPCPDETGETGGLAPGSECGSLPLDPFVTSTSWDQRCASATIPAREQCEDEASSSGESGAASDGSDMRGHEQRACSCGAADQDPGWIESVLFLILWRTGRPRAVPSRPAS